jgi:hypothetical protein
MVTTRKIAARVSGADIGWGTGDISACEGAGAISAPAGVVPQRADVRASAGNHIERG